MQKHELSTSCIPWLKMIGFIQAPFLPLRCLSQQGCSCLSGKAHSRQGIHTSVGPLVRKGSRSRRSWKLMGAQSPHRLPPQWVPNHPGHLQIGNHMVCPKLSWLLLLLPKDPAAPQLKAAIHSAEPLWSGAGERQRRGTMLPLLGVSCAVVVRAGWAVSIWRPGRPARPCWRLVPPGG